MELEKEVSFCSSRRDSELWCQLEMGSDVCLVSETTSQTNPKISPLSVPPILEIGRKTARYREKRQLATSVDFQTHGFCHRMEDSEGAVLSSQEGPFG